MVSCALVLVPLWWIHSLSGGCRAEELTREAVLSWFGGRVLEGLGLDEPPLASARGPDPDPAQRGGARPLHARPPRSRGTWEDHRTGPTQDKSQIILFPSSGEKLLPTSSFGPVLLCSMTNVLLYGVRLWDGSCFIKQDV